MINISNSSELTKIYLVTNCYGDPNKVYIGKENYSSTKRSRKYDHKKTFGKNIIFTYIDEINSIEHKLWKPLECYWIEQFRQWGFDIQNKNGGGTGPSFQSQQTKIKISIGQSNKIHKKITQYNLDGEFIKTWNSFIEIKKFLGFIKSVQKCCRYELKTSHGYIWRYENDPLPKNYKTPITKKAKPVLQYDIDGNFIKRWDGMFLVSKELGISVGNIISCKKGIYKHAGGFLWKDEK